MSFRRWRSMNVVWGSTMCEAPGCVAAAEVLADHDDTFDEGVPVCLEDADRMLERAAAVDAAHGRFIELPDPWEYQRERR